jgi:hypothetical protein
MTNNVKSASRARDEYNNNIDKRLEEKNCLNLQVVASNEIETLRQLKSELPSYKRKQIITNNQNENTNSIRN